MKNFLTLVFYRNPCFLNCRRAPEPPRLLHPDEGDVLARLGQVPCSRSPSLAAAAAAQQYIKYTYIDCM